MEIALEYCKYVCHKYVASRKFNLSYRKEWPRHHDITIAIVHTASYWVEILRRI